MPQPFRQDSCARNPPPGVSRLLVAQRTGIQPPGLRHLSKTFSLLPYYLHLNSSPGLPFSNVNVSASKSANFTVSVIVLPLIEPVKVAGCCLGSSSALTGPPRSIL